MTLRSLLARWFDHLRAAAPAPAIVARCAHDVPLVEHCQACFDDVQHQLALSLGPIVTTRGSDRAN